MGVAQTASSSPIEIEPFVPFGDHRSPRRPSERTLAGCPTQREDDLTARDAPVVDLEPRPSRPPASGPIAYVTSQFPKLSETFVLREILQLIEEGHSVSVFPLLRADEPVRHAEATALTPRVHHTPLLSRAVVAANLRSFWRAPRRYLRLLRTVLRENGGRHRLSGAIAIVAKSVYIAAVLERAGIRHVHAHSATQPALAALIISELIGIGFSFTAHEHDSFAHVPTVREKLKRARFVVCTSAYNTRYLTRLWPEVSPERVKIVHCGVDSASYQGRRERCDQRFTVVCVASLQPQKGIRHLLDACVLLRRRLGDLRCLLIGDGPQRAQLERMITDLGLRDTVSLLGAQPQDRVTALLGEADVFVLPSVVAGEGQTEGIPVALMEAMASGLPVVATRLSGIPELVEHGVNGLLVPPGDEHALAEAIATLHHSPPRREQLGLRGRQKVADDFDLAHNVRQLSALFREAVRPVTGMARPRDSRAPRSRAVSGALGQPARA